jgi:hypothetical protein
VKARSSDAFTQSRALHLLRALLRMSFHNMSATADPPSETVNDLPLLHRPAPLISPPGDIDPWQDQAQDQDGSDHVRPPLQTPDPSVLDESATASIVPLPSDISIDPDLHKQVLCEFDPFTAEEEKDAREAWAHQEGHPPPPQTPSLPPTPPQKDNADSAPSSDSLPSQPSPSSQSTFHSLAALARTFSIPAIARPRPVSFDVAKSVPSPATLSSIASNQKSDAPTTGSSSPSGSGSESPRRGDGGKDKDRDPPFDFQNFLDQMKLKGAEPVAKFLRSYVTLHMPHLLCTNSKQLFEQLRQTDIHSERSSQDYQ